MDYRSGAALAASALEAGAERVSLGRIRWDASAGCESPGHVEVHVRPDAWAYQGRPQGFPPDWWEAFKKAGLLQKELRMRGFAYDGKHASHPLWIEMEVPCRRCGTCLLRRARKWRTAAMAELERASRTWFCTFTLTEHEQFMLTCRASQAELKRSVVFDELTAEDMFRARVRAFGPDLTRFLKRVRKNSGSKIRYLFVAEAHRSGLPHWHALVHEVDPTRPLRKRCVEDAWGYGFTNIKLVSDKAPAWYVCKYLTKSVATRVRSSLHYGKETAFADRTAGSPSVINCDPPKLTVDGD